MSMAQFIAWECAFALTQDYSDRLTPAQAIVCHLAVMSQVETVPLEIIALACQVMGARQ